MRKLVLLLMMSLIALFLIACSSDDQNEEAELDTSDEEEISDEDVDNDDEALDSESDDLEEENAEAPADQIKESAWETYPDDLEVGDSTEFERNDMSEDHVEIKVNSFEVVDELDGESPENDMFLLVNVTIEDLLEDYNYEADFIETMMDDNKGNTYQNLRENRDEPAPQFEEDESGITTGDVAFDVSEDDYYRMKMFDEYYLLFMDDLEE